MSLFALPIPPGLSTPGRAKSLRAPVRGKKRKRASSPTPSESSSDDNKPSSTREKNALFVASTNPLSLAPSEVLQYRLAGLELDQELPSTKIRDFPHRGLPETAPARRRRSKSRSQSKGRDRFSTFDSVIGEDILQEEVLIEPEKKGRERGPRLRTHHWGVLTTVLHKCLLDGDIPRASRAWALLLRAEIAGKGIEIRQSGYWGIGAELLIRSQESKGKAVENDQDGDPDHDDDDDDDDAHNTESEHTSGEKVWGTPAGIAKAKEYFERLILQHPYMRQYHGSVTALDFYPAMFGCEIYGIQFKHKEALKKISKEEEQEDEDEASSSEESEEDEDEEEEDARERRRARRRLRRKEKRWNERDKIRSTSLIAAEKVATKMDELMSGLPYSESHVFLRFRGMLALYIADLYVPDFPEDDDGVDEVLQGHSRSGPELRLAKIQRRKVYETGKQMQEEERTLAKNLLEKLSRQGGRVSMDLSTLLPDPEQEEDGEDEDEDENSKGSDRDDQEEDYTNDYDEGSEAYDIGTSIQQDTNVDGNGDDDTPEDTDVSMQDPYEHNQYRRNAFNERDSGSDTDT
ncbi:hypothetical protein PVAG01_10050 [Phlyctema vagabunda]|uniref:Uncharacterized protein n=1 Tax=Phlyctema vagabunda TaxID=108571 RepID=A0ABR4P4U2_9HELO